MNNYDNDGTSGRYGVLSKCGKLKDSAGKSEEYAYSEACPQCVPFTLSLIGGFVNRSTLLLNIWITGREGRRILRTQQIRETETKANGNLVRHRSF